jgi:hypothetical protein
MAYEVGEDSADQGRSPSVLRRAARVPVPEWLRSSVGSARSDVAGRVVTTTARLLTIVIPTMIAIVGLSLALVASVLADRDSTEAIGTLGIELGAAMWFAGAIVVGGRPHPTVLRITLLAAAALGGVLLVATALLAGWTGTALDLAMEFGVGAVAIVVLDVIILGVVQSRLDQLAQSTDVGSPPIT